MHKPRVRGLTLIELMVTIAVLVIVIAIGVPSFEGTLNSSRLSSSANELTGAVQLARAESIRRNRSVVLCRSETLAACASGDEWSAWIVFVDTNGDGAVSVGEEILKTGVISAPLTVRASAAISSRGHIVTFMPNGIARAADESALLNAALAICVASVHPAQNARELLIAFGGRTAVRSVATGGTCDTAPNDT